MDSKRFVLIALILTIALLTGFLIGLNSNSYYISERSYTVYDTIKCYSPLPQAELTVGSQIYTLPKYYFIGGGAGGEPRQRYKSQDMIVNGDTLTHPMYGISDGVESQYSMDSMTVELPKIQRQYADSTYEAWVSGPLDPRLDSLNIFRPTTIITKKEWKPPKRWHIGLTAGYGYGTKGFQPYIGVGITYSIVSF